MRKLLWLSVFAGSLVVLTIAACNNGRSETRSDPKSIERGASLYNKLCISCHGGPTGGEITDRPPPHNANGHTWHHPDQQLTSIIRNGIDASVEPQKMPAFKDKLNEQDVKDILEYIRTWWTEEQREFQRTATQQVSDYEKGK